MVVRKLIVVLVLGIFLFSCTRKDIQFGDDPESSYTNLVYTDTISAVLSTVLMDSFATDGATSFFIGRYSDPYLGTVSARNFFQLSVPAEEPSIPPSAVYDSLVLIFRPNDYYYGDTSKSQTIYVNELAETISYSYNSHLYNTSSITVKPTPLGSRSLRIRPVGDDSLIIRLNDTKGQELFTKLRDLSTDVTSQDEFINYFKGISLSSGGNDTAAIYGIDGGVGSLALRVCYHTTFPYPEDKYIDFISLANNYAFNQLLPDRSNTGLVTGGSNGITETSAAQTGNHSFLQAGLGVYLKMIFPSLRTLIYNDKIVKLIKAELLVRPTYLSFDNNKYKLPSSIYLATTDASNIVGSTVVDSVGSGTLYASPVTDELYGEDNYYRFNITAYINQMLTTAGSEDNGFFILQDLSSSENVDRLVVNNSLHGSQSSKLLLHMIVINK